MNKVSPTTSYTSHIATCPWIAFDMEWEDSASTSHAKNTIIESSHDYNEVTCEHQESYYKITTFAYEDSYGYKRALDIADFAFSQNPGKEFLLAVRDKLLLYDYAFAWGSRAVKYKKNLGFYGC